MKAVTWLGAIALAATVACGNTGEPSATAGADENGGGLDELAPTMADAICDFFERCGRGLESGEGLDPDYCRPELTKILEDRELAEVRMQIESGRAWFDPARARECFDGVGDSCDQQNPWDCFELSFEGTVPPGGDCDDNDQCVGEAECLVDASCPGTCTELVGAGQPCDPVLMLCAGALYCSGASTCEPEVGAGEPCDNRSDSYIGCQAGLSCTNGSATGGTIGGTPGTCTPPPGPGDPCFGQGECGESSTCVVAPAGGASTCVARGALGEPCAVADVEGCVAGSYCVGGTCQSYASLFAADEGATCDPGKGSTYCRAELSCALFAVEPAQMWTCVGPSSLGGACRFGSPDPCPPDDYCSDTSPQTGDFEGTCATLPRDGQPCALAELQCASGHICVEDAIGGTCRARQRIGDPCTVEDECYSLFCDAGRCAVRIHGLCGDEKPP